MKQKKKRKKKNVDKNIVNNLQQKMYKVFENKYRSTFCIEIMC